jgi:hypothetical protein
LSNGNIEKLVALLKTDEGGEEITLTEAEEEIRNIVLDIIAELLP